jgi:hypothetical protein
MASLQAVAARPVACRAQAAGIRHAQAPRARPALRSSVLVRADPKACISTDPCAAQPLLSLAVGIVKDEAAH